MPHTTPAKSSAEIARDLADAIVGGRLPPGTKLKEEALARLYSVSRTKIRAALLMLAKDELIETAPDKSASVSRLSRDEATQIFDVRRTLEAALMREFVRKARLRDYQRIEAHLARERKAIAAHDVRLRTRLLAEFHGLLADVVGNKVLHNILQKLTARTAVTVMRRQTEQAAACSSDEHALIIKAARAGDVERAVELTLHHLRDVQQAIDGEEEPAAGDLVAALLTGSEAKA